MIILTAKNTTTKVVLARLAAFGVAHQIQKVNAMSWIPTKDSMKGDHALNSGDIPSYLALSEHAIFQCPALVGLGHCPFPVDGP